MRTFPRHTLWTMLTVTAVAGATAVGVAQLDVDKPEVTARDARELSTVFRHVAKSTLPSIVSVEARGKAETVQRLGLNGGTLPFGEDSPFKEFFENDPQLKRFFERQQENGDAQPRMQQSLARGTGFVIDADGVIMTNAHVLRGAESVTVRFNDGRELKATDWAADARSDIAVVRVESPEPLKPLELGDSDQAQIGDWVLAVGSPFGLDLSVTAGIISAKSRGVGINKREDFLQTDAAINPGNSGGPLLNLDGEAIGVNTAISSRSGGYDGVGFAVPINMARWVAEQLVEDGTVHRGFLGVTIQPVDAALAQQFGVTIGRGAIVGSVLDDSPAEAAGFQPGDVILEFAGNEVDGPRALQGIVEQLAIGDTYEAVVLRDGTRKTLDVTIREMPEDYATKTATPESTPTEPEATSFDELGLAIESVTEETAKRLQMNEPRGVFVTEVEAGSPAGNAGLKQGSVILRVGKQDVNSPAEFREALEQHALEDGVLLLVRSSFGGQGFVVLKNE